MSATASRVDAAPVAGNHGPVVASSARPPLVRTRPVVIAVGALAVASIVGIAWAWSVVPASESSPPSTGAAAAGILRGSGDGITGAAADAHAPSKLDSGATGALKPSLDPGPPGWPVGTPSLTECATGDVPIPAPPGLLADDTMALIDSVASAASQGAAAVDGTGGGARRRRQWEQQHQQQQQRRARARRALNAHCPHDKPIVLARPSAGESGFIVAFLPASVLAPADAAASLAAATGPGPAAAGLRLLDQDATSRVCGNASGLIVIRATGEQCESQQPPASGPGPGGGGAARSRGFGCLSDVRRHVGVTLSQHDADAALIASRGPDAFRVDVDGPERYNAVVSHAGRCTYSTPFRARLAGGGRYEVAAWHVHTRFQGLSEQESDLSPGNANLTGWPETLVGDGYTPLLRPATVPGDGSDAQAHLHVDAESAQTAWAATAPIREATEGAVSAGAPLRASLRTSSLRDARTDAAGLPRCTRSSFEGWDPNTGGGRYVREGHDAILARAPWEPTGTDTSTPAARAAPMRDLLDLVWRPYDCSLVAQPHLGLDVTSAEARGPKTPGPLSHVRMALLGDSHTFQFRGYLTGMKLSLWQALCRATCEGRMPFVGDPAFFFTWAAFASPWSDAEYNALRDELHGALSELGFRHKNASTLRVELNTCVAGGYDMVYGNFGTHPASARHHRLWMYRAEVEFFRDAMAEANLTSVWQPTPAHRPRNDGAVRAFRDWRTLPRVQLFNEIAAQVAASASPAWPVVPVWPMTAAVMEAVHDEHHFTWVTHVSHSEALFNLIADMHGLLGGAANGGASGAASDLRDAVNGNPLPVATGRSPHRGGYPCDSDAARAVSAHADHPLIQVHH